MTLQLELTDAPAEAIDVSRLAPHLLAQLDLDRIRALPMRMGKRVVELGELFRVSGTPGERVEFYGATRLLDFLGAQMQGGSITVYGDAGLLTAARLQAGTVHVVGNCGDRAASGMRGGMLVVEGRVGDGCAAAEGADPLGMRGGAVVIRGSAGNRFAARMRRGTAVVAGHIGDDACCQMVAGTVVALAGLGRRPALGMRRGTLVTRGMPTPLPSWFSRPERYVSSFSRMLAQRINSLLADEEPRVGIDFERCVGDLSVGGQGELLIERA